MLQLLSYLAQQKREFINARQAEGITAVKEKGVRFYAKLKEKAQYIICIYKRGNAAIYQLMCNKRIKDFACLIYEVGKIGNMTVMLEKCKVRLMFLLVNRIDFNLHLYYNKL